MMIDIFIWDTLFGMKRKLHFSFCEKDRSGLTDDEGLAKFKKHPAIMWTGGQSTLVSNSSDSSHAGAPYCIITRPSHALPMPQAHTICCSRRLPTHSKPSATTFTRGWV